MYAPLLLILHLYISVKTEYDTTINCFSMVHTSIDFCLSSPAWLQRNAIDSQSHKTDRSLLRRKYINNWLTTQQGKGHKNGIKGISNLKDLFIYVTNADTISKDRCFPIKFYHVDFCKVDLDTPGKLIKAVSIETPLYENSAYHSEKVKAAAVNSCLSRETPLNE